MRYGPVYTVGSKVVVGGGEAIITAICLRDTEATYEVVYWRGADRKSEWVHSFEVSPTPSSGRVELRYVEGRDADGGR